MTLTHDEAASEKAASGARTGTGTAAGAEGGATQSGWNLGRLFMLRVAAMPFAAVDALRCPGAAVWARGVLEQEQRLREAGAALSDPIGALVPAIEDERERRRLLDLRRQVFNNKLPRDVDAALGIAATLDDAVGRPLAAWLDERARWEELRSAGADTFSGELAHSRAELLRLVGDDRLRLGLLLASPTLDGQMGAFLRGGTLDKRGRKTERSLLSYLYRTACKTSPFSTFTALALGRFDAELDHDAATRISGRWRSHPRLNVVVLARLAECITANPELRADLPVTLASGWHLDDDRIRYVQRSHEAGGDDSAVSFDAARDRLFFLRRSGALESLLAHLADRPSVRYRDLVALLAARQDATQHEADQYISALVELGILQPAGLHTDVHSTDPVRDFQRALRLIGRPWADRAADLLDGPISCVDRYAAADLQTRRTLLAALRRDVDAVLEALGAPGASVPRTILYEDVRAEDDFAVCAGQSWTDLAAGPLHALSRILPAFDISLPQRLTLKGFFLARHGAGARCDDLLKFVHDFHEDLFDQYLRLTSGAREQPDGSPAPEENWLRLPEITALDRARAAFVDGMRRRWAAHPPEAEEFELDDALVEQVAACLAALPAEFTPHSHFLQLARRGEDPLAVLNDSFGGLYFPFTRFTHCFEAPPGGLSDRLQQESRRRPPPGAVFAEVTAGAATTNLNLHGRLTDYEIVCPGEPSSASARARIELDDLYLEHDRDADRLVLRSRRLGCEVIPLYLGYLLPMMLPEIPRTLLLLSPTSRAAVEVWRGVPEQVPDSAEGGAVSGAALSRTAAPGVSVRPRVRYRSLVLRRRSWTAAPGTLPPRAAPHPDADWFLGWQRWRAANRLPVRAFATVHDPDTGSGRPSWLAGSKPQYTDFDSPLSLVALEGLTADPGCRVVFEEMLPAPDELHVASAEGGHVAELALEILPATDHNSADQDSADQDSADQDSADQDSADRDSADRDSADRDSADRDSADRDSADRDSADRDSADRDSADRDGAAP